MGTRIVRTCDQCAKEAADDDDLSTWFTVSFASMGPPEDNPSPFTGTVFVAGMVNENPATVVEVCSLAHGAKWLQSEGKK